MNAKEIEDSKLENIKAKKFNEEYNHQNFNQDELEKLKKRRRTVKNR